MTRILFVVNGEYYAGAEKVQELLAQNLPSLGFDVGVVCLKDGLLQKFFQAQGSPIYTFAMRHKFDLSPVRRVAELVRREGYSIIHTHTPRSALIGRIVSSRTQVPMIHHVHSPTVRDTERAVRNRINGLVENWAAKRASRLITVSRSLSRHMAACGFAERHITFVPNGVPIQADHDLKSGAPGEKGFTVGAVALFRPRKGLDVLIKAIGQLRREGLVVRLLAVGGFETTQYEREMLELAASEGVSDAIDWTGFTTDVAKFLRQMDLFVMPSLFGEGLPMAMIEAMASGVAVVASDVEGIPEVLAEGAGIVVSPGNVDQLAAAIRRCCEDPRFLRAMAADGLTRQRALYSDAAMARGVASVYAEVLAARGA